MGDTSNLKSENRLSFEQAINQAISEKMDAEIESLSDEDFEYHPTVTHRRNMNRLFREKVGSKKIPHPEVDTLYERVRSWFVVKLHLKYKTIKHKRR